MIWVWSVHDQDVIKDHLGEDTVCIPQILWCHATTINLVIQQDLHIKQAFCLFKRES